MRAARSDVLTTQQIGMGSVTVPDSQSREGNLLALVRPPPPPAEGRGRTRPSRARVNPRPVRGAMQPPCVFLSWTPHRLENRADIFLSLCGIFCVTFGETKLLCQVRSRSYEQPSTRFQTKSWANATWRGAIDLNGDNWWDWCQYVTGCDCVHCTRWVSRSTKVTWGHLRSLTSVELTMTNSQSTYA